MLDDSSFGKRAAGRTERCTSRGWDGTNNLSRHRRLLDWHIPRCGADCCPGNDMRLPVCSPSPSIVKLENLWDWPRAKVGVVELKVCSACYHIAECHVGFEVYKEML